MPKRRRPDPEDEQELWRSVTADVTPLRRTELPEPVPDAPPQPEPPVARPRPPNARATVATSTPRPELRADVGTGVDKRTFQRLRRGQLPISARLDLHGMTQQAAHAALNSFICDGVAAGRRCVIVITGKGQVSTGGGILRKRLPQWLNLDPCREHVLAFAPAQPAHGGDGAFYVLLRRQR